MSNNKKKTNSNKSQNIGQSQHKTSKKLENDSHCKDETRSSHPLEEIFDCTKTSLILSFLFMVLLFYWSYSLFSDLHEIINSSKKSPEERYVAFYSEQAFYYSYYKKFLSAPSFSTFLNYIMVDKTVEYPRVINPFKRFNIFPELGCAIFNRYIVQNIPGISFFYGKPLDESFDISLYLQVVCVFWGFLLVAIYLTGFTFTRSVSGGVVSSLLTFFHFFWVSRAQNHPILRENFAIPFVYLKSSLIMIILRKYSYFSSGAKGKILLCYYVISVNWLLLWQFSQFPTFLQIFSLYLTYICGYADASTIRHIYLTEILSVFTASFLMFGNEMLLNSMLLHILLICYCLTFFEIHKKFYGNFILSLGIVPILFSAAAVFSILLKLFTAQWLIKTIFPGWGDDSHVLAILVSKYEELSENFPSYLKFSDATTTFLAKDANEFESALYHCGQQYNAMPSFVTDDLKKSWLIQLSCVGLFVGFLKLFCDIFYKHQALKNPNFYDEKFRDPALPFMLAQSSAFILLGLSIMRMLPFFTPTLCIATGFLFTYDINIIIPFGLNPNYSLPAVKKDSEITAGMNQDEIPSPKSKHIRHRKGQGKFRNTTIPEDNVEKNLKEKKYNLLFYLLVSLVSITGYYVLTHAYNTIYLPKMASHKSKGIDKNDSKILLAKWIKTKTKKSDVFTSSMVVSSQILLQTGSRITIHPHAENAEMKDRYRYQYQYHNRVPDKDVYQAMKHLKSDYLILAMCDSRCKEGRYSDIAKKNGLSKNWSSSLKPFCQRIVDQDKWDTSLFEEVWATDTGDIIVLKVKYRN